MTGPFNDDYGQLMCECGHIANDHTGHKCVPIVFPEGVDASGTMCLILCGKCDCESLRTQEVRQGIKNVDLDSMSL